jgi:hypothetical protein
MKKCIIDQFSERCLYLQSDNKIHVFFFSLDEEREHFRRDTERQALFQLDKARTKPVVFAVKTNVAFDGSLDDDSPVHGSAVSFGIGDYLHVMERYDPNWWIGRKVGPVFFYGGRKVGQFFLSE